MVTLRSIVSLTMFTLLSSFSIEGMDFKRTFINTLLECHIKTAPNRSMAHVGGQWTNLLCNRASFGPSLAKTISVPTSWFSRHGTAIRIVEKRGDDYIEIDQIPYAQLGVTELYSVRMMHDSNNIVFFADKQRIIAYNLATKEKLFDITVDQPANTKEIIKVEADGKTLRYQFLNDRPEVSLESLSEEQHLEHIRQFSSKISVALPFDIASAFPSIEAFIKAHHTEHDLKQMQSILTAIRTNTEIELNHDELTCFKTLPSQIQALITESRLIKNIPLYNRCMALITQRKPSDEHSFCATLKSFNSSLKFLACIATFTLCVMTANQLYR